MFYHFKIHKDNDGLWAECLELEGCQTQADSMDELQENMKEVLNLFLSEPIDSKMIFPMPNLKKMNANSRIIIAKSLRKSPPISFSYRQMKSKKPLRLKPCDSKYQDKSVNPKSLNMSKQTSPPPFFGI